MNIKQEHPQKKSNRKYLLLIPVLFVGLTLPFHYVIHKRMIFPKENLTFSNTFVTEEDIDALIDRYNNSTFFEKAATLQDPFYKKLVEKGILNPKRWHEGDDASDVSGVVIKIVKDEPYYEGQLNLMTFGASKSANISAEPFDFSVPTDEREIIKILEDVSLSGERVRLLYYSEGQRHIVVKVDRGN